MFPCFCRSFDVITVKIRELCFIKGTLLEIVNYNNSASCSALIVVLLLFWNYLIQHKMYYSLSAKWPYYSK